jgi:hypothetical protein
MFEFLIKAKVLTLYDLASKLIDLKSLLV